MTTRPGIAWREEYAVGVAVIDSQHRTLLGLLNEVCTVDESLPVEPGMPGRLTRPLEKLNDYAGYHFLAEEALMREHLPVDEDSAAHIGAHRSYWASIASFRQRYEQGGEPVGAELVSYLERWWLQHILETDRRLGQRLNQAGVR